MIKKVERNNNQGYICDRPNWKFDVSWLSKINWMQHPASHVATMAQLLSQNKKQLREPNFLPPDPPILVCLCMHTYTSDIHVTPLLKILVMGLYTHAVQVQYAWIHVNPCRSMLNNQTLESNKLCSVVNAYCKRPFSAAKCNGVSWHLFSALTWISLSPQNQRKLLLYGGE